MDATAFTLRYCSTKSALEEQAQILTAKLCSLATRLTTLVGIDHQAFSATKTQCVEVRDRLTISRRQLDTHRAKHGC